jgi:magnesium-transporting ATPase (P-type)
MCLTAAAFLALPLVASAQDDTPKALPAVLGAGVVGFFLIFLLAMYVYVALALQTIAQKTNTENGWLAWIPIANIILMLNIARKPIWWIVLFLIPLVGLVMYVIVWMGIAEARNKPSWWGVMVIVPVMNLIKKLPETKNHPFRTTGKGDSFLG